MTTSESKQRDTTVIMHILKTFRTELMMGYVNPESTYAYIRYNECWHFINGYYMGSNTCTYYKCLLAEHYLDTLVEKYDIRLR